MANKIKVSKGTKVEVLTEMDELIIKQQNAYDAWLAAENAVKAHKAFLLKESKKAK